MYRITNHDTGEIFECPYWGEGIQLAVDYAMSKCHKVTCEWVEENPTTTLHMICRNCGERFSITVPVDGLMAWEDGANIQDAMPEVSPEIRESLITGLCKKCQL